MSDYTCKECGMAVIMKKDGTQLRPCGHTGTILATMGATAKGVGSASQKR
jgi:uncharacterized Zn finger protein (UPF0148 family)